jgi:hypothetical protein
MLLILSIGSIQSAEAELELSSEGVKARTLMKWLVVVTNPLVLVVISGGMRSCDQLGK